MISRQHWPIIIAGAGPTGLTLASLLARYGVSVLVIERNASTVQEPRAVSIDDESLRTMQSVGIIHELIPKIVLGYGSEYFSEQGRSFLKVKPTTLEFGYPRRNAFRQPVLEAMLRDNLQRKPNASILFEHELQDFEQSGSGVSLRVSGGGATTDLTCDYLIGCDGSRSFVRQKLGIELHGSTFRERWLIVDLEQTTDPSRDTKVYCNLARPCLSLPGPNNTRRFEFMLHDGEQDADVLAPEHVASLLRLYGTDDQAVLRRKVIYTFHARLADRWRDRRVFLAGDAAHLMPPFAGQGMNSGVRDAHNLAWKLAAVVNGQLGDRLLDTYQQERLDHAQQMVQLAVRMGHVMMPKSKWRALAVQNAFRALRAIPPAHSYFAEMKYKPKPRFHAGFFVGASADPKAPSLVGKLFPQAPVMTATGLQMLDDALGDGFAWVASPGTPANLLTAAELGATMPQARKVAVLDKEDASAVTEPAVAVRDFRGEMARLLQAEARGLYLLRPDRYVAAFLPIDRIKPDAIAAMMRNTWAN